MSRGGTVVNEALLRRDPRSSGGSSKHTARAAAAEEIKADGTHSDRSLSTSCRARGIEASISHKGQGGTCASWNY